MFKLKDKAQRLDLKIVKIVSTIFIGLNFAATTLSAQSYSESPSLEKKVASGELPKLSKRLPKNPAVMEPIESIGDYSENIYVFVHFYLVCIYF